MNIEWKNMTPDLKYSIYVGYDENGNRYEMTADRERVTCTLKSGGFQGSSFTPEEACANALEYKRKHLDAIVANTDMRLIGNKKPKKYAIWKAPDSEVMILVPLDHLADRYAKDQDRPPMEDDPSGFLAACRDEILTDENGIAYTIFAEFIFSFLDNDIPDPADGFIEFKELEI